VYVARRGGVAASVLTGAPTQSNVTYSLGGTQTGNCYVEVWVGEVSTGASNVIGLSLADTADTAPVVVMAVEYEGLLYGPLDQLATNADYSNTLYSGTTGATAASAKLLIGAFASYDETHPQQTPSDGFGGIDQIAGTNGAGGVRLGLWEKIVPAGGATATVSVHSAFAVTYVGQIRSYLEDTSVQVDLDNDTDILIADTATIDQFLDVAVVETKQLSASLDIALRFQKSVDLSLLVKDDTFDLASELDVSVVPFHVADLSVTVFGEETVDCDLQVSTVLGASRRVNMGMLVKAAQTQHCGLNVGVLVPQPLANSITTPETYVYRECRPLWCGVPRTKRFDASLSVFISETNVGVASLMDMNVVAQRAQQGFCDVSVV